ncbi:MAG: ParB/RepB/Spo0J family partition protein [Ruminococcus sp.]|nr:ParB/RepB/Spo0J family partition protein [Ruminococcus sp.]MBQ3935927.1 ParB/RepB/Spo0J family partition protein [Ruminococcus sp.]
MSKKARMNRGLDALFSDNFAPEKETEKAEESGITTVSISLVEPNKNQPRTKFDDEKIAELTQSIKQNGILQPILVTPLDNGGYRIVAGERRWRAARGAGLKEIPVYIRKLDDKQVMQLALIENVQRQDLSPIEEARAYRQLMDEYKMTQQEVSEAVGKSRSVIANSLRLLTLCEPVVELLEKGELTVGHAKMLAGITDAQEQKTIAQLAVKNGFNVRQLEVYIAGQSGEKQKAKKPSLKQENPFLREFEISVNDNSNIKAKAKQSGGGATTVSLTIGKNVDVNAVLSKLAELLKNY